MEQLQVTEKFCNKPNQTGASQLYGGGFGPKLRNQPKEVLVVCEIPTTGSSWNSNPFFNGANYVTDSAKAEALNNQFSSVFTCDNFNN